MFSFFNNKSPSGSNVSATNTPSTDVEEVKSSFSFISGGGSGNDNISTSTEESTPASSGKRWLLIPYQICQYTDFLIVAALQDSAL